MNQISLSQLRVDDIEEASLVNHAAFPPPFPQSELWQPKHLLSHVSVFPEGQVVARIGDEIVGTCTSLIVADDNWHERRTWLDTAGGLSLENHIVEGTTLYGLDISVLPKARGLGVARALYGARFNLVRRLGLHRFGTACRLPGLINYPNYSPVAFVEAVIRGEMTDTPLTPFLRIGMTFISVIENYLVDGESRDCAALLEWTA